MMKTLRNEFRSIMMKSRKAEAIEQAIEQSVALETYTP